MTKSCHHRGLLVLGVILFGVTVSHQFETTPTSTTEEPHCITQQPQKLPTLYEYYSNQTKNQPLDINGTEFHLNGKQLVIYSGSFHYFRTVPERWEELLMKYRAAGLNTVQIYVPWNLHEDIPDGFDFDTPVLDLDRLLRLIKQYDMLAIVRPGPYICAEWEFGGLPSWLLRDPTMKIRSRHPYFMNRTEKYFRQVLSIVNRHQWSVTGGPVIMLQLENEYFGAPGDLQIDLEYLRELHKIVRSSGYKEALFTSDPLGVWIFHDLTKIFPEGDVLETANFNEKAAEYLKSLRLKQPNRPLFVTEFWAGWFDQWSEKHHKVAPEFFENVLREIVFTSNSSVNFYMFFGGTNFGFMNGARVTTSYDYDAPLSENGNYTDKYRIVKQVYSEMVLKGRMPNLLLPEMPKFHVERAKVLPEANITEFIPLKTILEHSSMMQSPTPLPMEQLDLGENFGQKYGQRYGFIMYRTRASFSAKEIEVRGTFHDRAMFLRDGVAFALLPDGVPEVNIKPKYASTENIVTYDFLVENQGRQNHQLNMDGERKGLINLDSDANIFLDQRQVIDYEIYSIDFNRTFMSKIVEKANRQAVPEEVPMSQGPALYLATVDFQTISDVWLSLPGWGKGQIFINDFNLGRYWNEKGPQTKFYVPKELLKVGTNIISMFETIHPGKKIHFDFE